MTMAYRNFWRGLLLLGPIVLNEVYLRNDNILKETPSQIQSLVSYTNIQESEI